MAAGKTGRRVVPPLDWEAAPAPAAAAPTSRPTSNRATKRPQATPKQAKRKVQAEVRPGRPQKRPDEGVVYVNTTVRFEDGDLNYLDDAVTTIKRRGGDRSLTRSEVIRAITAAFRQQGVDLSDAKDYESLVDLVQRKVRK